MKEEEMFETYKACGVNEICTQHFRLETLREHSASPDFYCLKIADLI
jgi:hypothetical protein